MDQFKKLYHEYCKTYQVEPNELLLGEIQKYKEKQIFYQTKINIFQLFKEFPAKIIKQKV
jgi:hypothetical protein